MVWLTILRELIRIDWFDTIRFNLHYFPITNALRLPVWLYNADIKELMGGVILRGRMRSGMVKLGKSIVPIYQDYKSFIYSNEGGILDLSKCCIGSGSSIVIKSGAELTIEDSFFATSRLKICCSNKIVLGANCIIGWSVDVDDSNKSSLQQNATIELGKASWVANNSCLSCGCKIPQCSVVASNTTVSESFSERYILIAGNPAQVIKQGVVMDQFCDKYIR